MIKLQFGYLFLFLIFLIIAVTSSATASKPTGPRGEVTLVGPDRVTLRDVTLEYSPHRGLPPPESIEIEVEGRKVFIPWREVESLTLVTDATPPHWRVKLKDGRTFPDYGSLHADTEFIGEISIDGIGPYGGVESHSESPQDPSSQDFRKIIVNF